TGTNTKFGVYVNIPSTTGANYGIYSTVNTSNIGSYAASLNGKVYCSGDVGIGTIYPDAQLHVDLGEDAEPGSGGYIISGATSSTNIAIDNNEIMARIDGAVSTLHLNNDGGNVSMCYASGNVMIGASVPATGYLLSVDGKIMCEELKVQLSESWPDYVFADDYKLMNLYELEKSIQKNNHLPNIPSAKEIETNGIAVGEMQKMMMEKIEELTLYIIELKKQNDTLAQKVSVLENK
ncbi:MAG: hypothetical protein H7X71_00130, partial [Chitinophagales bacterium]|nr:hypothetical protein [Chitinophagales bacterium]